MLKFLSLKNRQGFSLVAVTLVLVVLGSLVLIWLMPQNAGDAEKIESTQKKLLTIRTALFTFSNQNSDAFPCPAGLTTQTSNQNFGRQLPIDNATKCRTEKCPLGSNPDIFCTKAPTSEKTWIGAVPVRELGLPDEAEFDAWGNRFIYAVNNDQSFSVKDRFNGNVLANVKFHVLSFGPDGVGAFMRNGTPSPRTCVAPILYTSTHEYHNCKFETLPLTDDSFITTPWDTTPGSQSYYDDLSIPLQNF